METVRILLQWQLWEAAACTCAAAVFCAILKWKKTEGVRLMELKQLQYFRKAAKTKSISAAAEALYITQPALSRCIKRLEEEVGVSLLQRTSSGVELTAAGAALMAELDQVFEHLEHGLSSARLIGNQQLPTLNVVYCFEEFDTGIIYQLHSAFPDVRTSVDILPPDQAYRELLAGKVDFAVLPQVPEHPGIRFRRLGAEEMMLSFPEGHPLSGRAFVLLEELDGLDVVCNEVGFDWNSIQRICEEHGISMNLKFSSNSHQTVGRLHNMMQSALFVPIGSVAEFRDSGRNRELPARVVPQVFRRNIVVAWPEQKRLTTAEKYFMELLQRSNRQIQQKTQEFCMEVFGRGS